MERTFDINALDVDRLEWLLFEDYEPPLDTWVLTRHESRFISGLYGVYAVRFDGEKWYNIDGEEVEVTEFAEVEE